MQCFSRVMSLGTRQAQQHLDGRRDAATAKTREHESERNRATQTHIAHGASEAECFGQLHRRVDIMTSHTNRDSFDAHEVSFSSSQNWRSHDWLPYSTVPTTVAEQHMALQVGYCTVMTHVFSMQKRKPLVMSLSRSTSLRTDLRISAAAF